MPAAWSTYHYLWAWTGARFAKHPSKRLFVIGITGTKGKSTTLELLNAILEAGGKQTALISSIREKIGDASIKNPSGNSMPGHGGIQGFLRRARRAGCTYALVEVTSQGVVQHRHRFIDWNLGVITNLHPEHIESHGSYEKYRAAKLAFLKYVVRRHGKVFLNSGDKEFEFFARELAHAEDRTVHYSRSDEFVKDVVAKAARAGTSRFLLNDFNEENVAAAIAIARELGIANTAIEEAVRAFQGVPGRMEFVAEGPYTAIVDYAHTPDSLEAAYRAARKEQIDPECRLICVLGAAGGGRDTWKRAEFGKIAAHYCDEVIITNEDPYDEDPEKIIDAVATGAAQVPYPRPDIKKILDRREALEYAIEIMDEGDIVIATGKGSEDWIHGARGKKITWNEKAIVQELLAAKNSRPPRERGGLEKLFG